MRYIHLSTQLASILATTVLAISLAVPLASTAEELAWSKHTIYSGAHCSTAVAADFTGDGLQDVICNAGGATRLLVAPDWSEVILDSDSKRGLIHSESLDVDHDGDPDFIGARYKPGLVFWLERPNDPLSDRWVYHLIDDQVDGIHGLLVGDVDVDGKPDLLANKRSAHRTVRKLTCLVSYPSESDGCSRVASLRDRKR